MITMNKTNNILYLAIEAQKVNPSGSVTVRDILSFLDNNEASLRKSISNVLNQVSKRSPEILKMIGSKTSDHSGRQVNIFKATKAGMSLIEKAKKEGAIKNQTEIVEVLMASNRTYTSGKSKSIRSKAPAPAPATEAPPPINNMSSIAEELVNTTSKLLHQNQYYRTLLLETCSTLAKALDMKLVDKNFQPPQTKPIQGDFIDG